MQLRSAKEEKGGGHGNISPDIYITHAMAYKTELNLCGCARLAPLVFVDPSSPSQTTQHSGTSPAQLFSQPELTVLREEMGPGG